MPIDLNDEILQDFLIEAGEILDLLGEQLVELEKSPDDVELLNAIFRGFHTVKGGAGFLAIDPLVNICHQAEDVFNILRQGDRKVTAELMDVILRVLDDVNEMFDLVRSGQEPDSADPALLTALQVFTVKECDQQSGINPEMAEIKKPVASEQSYITENASDAVAQAFESMLGGGDNKADNDEITEQEFEDLLDALHGKGGSPTPKKNAEPEQVTATDEISEDEFEDLLDELHGKGKFSGTVAKASEDSGRRKSIPQASVTDEITEQEFDKLLDDLHGKGKFTGKPELQNPKDQQGDAGLTGTESDASANPPKQGNQDQAATKPKTETKPASQAAKKMPGKKTPKPAAGQSETTVRVDTQVLDDIMNMVGELVLVRNRFQTLREAGNDEQIAKAIGNLDVVTADLQLAVMKTRMQPIKKVFGRFPRLVRDLARSLQKEIKLELIGEETDLDKNLVEALADPLVHLVRNAVDHGIEIPEERVAAGKPREGVVVLTASQEGDHIELTIEDSGKGMNANVLRQKAVEKGMMDEESAARLDDKECFNLIFAPGFSTKSEISDVSGRGVGMDVVKTRIAQMNGTVEIDSKEGQGSTIIIKVPLTLAIMPTLMVRLGGQAFALPLVSVLEILDLDLGLTNVVDGQLVVMVRGRAMPLFYLSDWLVKDPEYITDKGCKGHVVVVNAGGIQVGLVVDQLIGQEEVVIKALGAKLHGLDGLAGATITGDGKIALILDVPGLIKRYAA